MKVVYKILKALYNTIKSILTKIGNIVGAIFIFPFEVIAFFLEQSAMFYLVFIGFSVVIFLLL